MKKLLFCLCNLLCLFGTAQFISTPPIRNGMISTNEYGDETLGTNAWSDGSRTWYMAWDANNLYIAVNGNGNASTDELVLYIDTDQTTPSNTGNGSLDGIGDFDGKNYGRLPFSANFNTHIRNDYHQHRTSSGSWSGANNNDASIQKTTSGNVQEIQIAWSLMGGRPTAFNCFFYLNGADPYGGVSNYNMNMDNDQGNNKLNLTGRRYFHISNTNNGSSTPPFSQLSYTNPRNGFNTISNYGNTFYNVTINTGTNTTSGITGFFTINGKMYIGNTDIYEMNNNLMILNGDIERYGVINTTMGQVIFAGTTNQTQIGNITYTGGLTMNKMAGKLILASNGSNAGIKIANNSTLNLSIGIIDSRTNNTLIEILNGSTILPGGLVSFIDGDLKIYNVGAMAKVFPVGRSSYNPATIVNNGTADDFTMNVGDYLTMDGTETGVNGANQIINRTWNISESTVGGSMVDLTLQWMNTGTEVLAGFNTMSCHVGHFNGGFWQGGVAGVAAIGNVSGSSTRVRTGINSFSPFGVASVGALATSFMDLKVTKKQKNNLLQWNTIATSNIIGYTLEKSYDGIRFEKAYYVTQQSGIAMLYHTDNVASAPILYYRIAGIKTDGSIVYSNIVSIQNTINCQITGIHKGLQINLDNGDALLQIQHTNGQLILQQKITKGLTTIPLYTSSGSTIYVVTVQQGTSRFSKQILLP